MAGSLIQQGRHLPVLVDSVCALLRPLHSNSSPLWLLDGTFGAGGHTRAVLQLHENWQAVALDRDPEAQHRAEGFANHFPGRFTFRRLNFRDLDQVPEGPFNAVLLDLGVSSFQLDTPQRGFSFRHPGPLDMRMDPQAGLSAAEFLESAPEPQLAYALRDLGEEPRWRAVVAAIVRARGTGILQETESFAHLVEGVLKSGYSKRHPATQVFQGVRMWVNQELPALEAALPKAFSKLKVGGLLMVISFHSLEDRLVKRYFRKLAGRPEHEQDGLPLQGRSSWGSLPSLRATAPSESEIAENPRSRSARLRVFLKEREGNPPPVSEDSFSKRKQRSTASCASEALQGIFPAPSD